MLGWVLVFLCSGILAQDYSSDEKSPFRFNYDFEHGKIVGRGLFQKTVPRFADLERDSAQFTSYEKFLDYLLEKAPSLRRNAVLLHHSQSVQLASPEFPRVLLFDGGMVYAFSEHPANRLPRVEILETDPVSYEVTLHEIVFKREGVELHRQPQACLACHGNPAKPIWDPYDFWPLAFGASVGDPLKQAEAEAYQVLRKSKSSPLLTRLQLPGKIGIGRPDDFNIFEENTSFTQYISLINFANWAKSIPENLDGFQYALLGTLGLCYSQGKNFEEVKSNWFQYFNETERDKIKTRLEARRTDVSNGRKHFKDYLDQLAENAFPQSPVARPIDHERLAEVDILSLLNFLYEASGINSRNMVTSLIANDYVVSTPANFPLDQLAALFEIRPHFFAGLDISEADLLVGGKYHWIRPDCGQVAKKSRAATRDWNKLPEFVGFSRLPSERPVVSRCAKCHVEKLNPRAPYIPFDNNLELAKALRDPVSDLAGEIKTRIRLEGKGQMPPGTENHLRPDEIQALEALVDILK